MSEGSRHFEENSAVFRALHKITRRLQTLDIPYVIVGGMALFRHGLRRFTEDVDILVTPGDLRTIHDKLEGLGYLPPFRNSKHLRDTELGVKVEFLTTGDFPGDGKPKPVAFPDPREVGVVIDGMNIITLPKLIELKLASGMTNAGRLKDLADVTELIKILDLPRDYATQLDPFVRDRYSQLWKDARRRYVMTWRNKWLTAEAKTIDDMAAMLRAAAAELEEMSRQGVILEEDGVGDDYAQLVTTDPKVAEKFGLIDEMEYWPDDVEEDGDDVPPTEPNDAPRIEP